MTNPKAKFIEIYNQLTEEAKLNFVYEPYGSHPRTIQVIKFEIMNNTKSGKQLLKEILK